MAGPGPSAHAKKHPDARQDRRIITGFAQCNRTLPAVQHRDGQGPCRQPPPPRVRYHFG